MHNLKLSNIDIVATGGKTFNVFVDDREVSTHNEIHKAIQRSVTEMIANPESKIRIRQNLEYRVEGEFDNIQTDDSDMTNGLMGQFSAI